MLQAVEYIFYISLLVFAGFYASYYFICYVYKSRTKRKIGIQISDQQELPKISLIVPVFNENKVLEKKIQNLKQLDYPKDKLEVVFVDGGSTDGSIETIKDGIKRAGLDIMLVEQGRRLGFNKAVIDGFQKSTGDIISIPGAESMYAPETLKWLVAAFSDPNVGAVNGRQVIENLSESISPKLEHAYRNIYDFLREAEDNIDTLFDVKGEIVAGRRRIVAELVNNPDFQNKGCIDACLFFQAKKDGYLSVYQPEAVYYELSPRSFRASFKQRYRRAATLIQNMFIFKNMTLNRKYGLFGTLIMPAHFLMLIILPYVFFAGLISFLALQIAFFPSIYLLALGLGGLIVLLFSRSVQTFVQLQIVLITSHVKMLKGVETQKFEKLESARPVAG